MKTASPLSAHKLSEERKGGAAVVFCYSNKLVCFVEEREREKIVKGWERNRGMMGGEDE